MPLFEVVHITTPADQQLTRELASLLQSAAAQVTTQHNLDSVTDTTVDSTYSSEMGLAGALAGAPDQVAAEGPPTYPSFEEPKVVSKSSRDPLPPPPTSKCPAPLLTYSDMWKADGLYTLPYFGCADRTFTFYSSTQQTRLAALDLYKTLRTSAPPERWCDLSGNPVTCGRATTSDRPQGLQVNTGPVLAGDLSKLPDMGECRYIVIVKAACTKGFGDKDGSAHLDGDPIYQWLPFVSLEHAREGVVDSLGMGYSVVGAWAELDVSQARAKRMRLSGKKIVVEKRRVFAAVDAAGSAGWRGWMRLLCNIF